MHDLGPVIAYYEHLLDEPDDRKATGWQIPFSRDVALLSLLRVDGLRDGARVLDVGCGFGALKELFDRLGPKVEYTGYDLSPRIVERAKQRHPEARFEVRDILRDPPRERFDFVFCSGALSFRLPDHGRYLIDMITAMYGLVDVALAFNMLSAWAYMESPTLQREATDGDYEWPDEIFRFCKTLSRHVSVQNDTHHGSFDVFVYRRNVGALRRYLDWAKPGTAYGPEVEAAIEYHLELGMFGELRDYLATLEPRPEVLNHLGQAYAGLGQRPQAIEAFTRASAANPNLPWPHVNLGKLAMQDKHAERAIEHFRHAVVISPGEPRVREELIKALLAAGRRAEARLAVMDLPEGPLRHYLHGMCADDPTAALAAFERAIAAAPSYLDPIVQAAFVKERLGDHAGALTLWRSAHQIAPVDPSILQRLEAAQQRVP
jgi:trans-aconitate methyltransferase/Tfp pilus assembly protein PilF